MLLCAITEVNAQRYASVILVSYSLSIKVKQKFIRKDLDMEEHVLKVSFSWHPITQTLRIF